MLNLKRFGCSIVLPAGAFIVLFIVSSINGVSYGKTAIFWELLLQNVFAAVCIAYALAVHIKSDRFDFSGGALMTIAGIAAGFYCKELGMNSWALLIGCILLCLIGSMLVATVYVYGKLPFIICTIGVALIFEAFTNVVNGGNGVAIVNEKNLNIFGKMPWMIVLALVGAVIYYLYSSRSISGIRANLLSSNQEAAVNIGINEKKNVYQAFLVSGLLYGLAATILVSEASPSLTSVGSTLGTVGTAFSSILPVYMGFFIGSYCNDTIGILLSTLTMESISYGIELNVSASLKTAYNYICLGVFMVLFFCISQQGREIMQKLKGYFGQKTKEAGN